MIDADRPGRRARASSTRTRTTTRSSPSSPTARRAATTASPPWSPATAASRSRRCKPGDAAVAHPAVRPGRGHGRRGPRGHPGRRLRDASPSSSTSIAGKIGINAAFYIGHCAAAPLRDGRRRPGARGHRRRDRARWRRSSREAMAAGAAGLLARTHSPTHFDSADRPVPSRLVEPRRAEGARREAAGRAGGGSLAYLPGLGRRRHHARRRGAAHRHVAAARGCR